MARLASKIHAGQIAAAVILALLALPLLAQEAPPPATPETVSKNVKWTYVNTLNQLVALVTCAEVTAKGEGTALMKKPEVLFYDINAKPDAQGNQPVLVKSTADSGVVGKSQESIQLNGNVHAISTDGIELATESLYVHLPTRNIKSDSRVVISRGPMKLSGTGLTGDSNLQKLVLLKEPVLSAPGPFDAQLFSAAAAPSAGPSPELLTVTATGPLIINAVSVAEGEPESAEMDFQNDASLIYEAPDNKITTLKAARLRMSAKSVKTPDATDDKRAVAIDTMDTSGGTLFDSPEIAVSCATMSYSAINGVLSLAGSPVEAEFKLNSAKVVCSKTAVLRKAETGDTMEFEGSVKFKGPDFEVYGESVRLVLAPSADTASQGFANFTGSSAKELESRGGAVLTRAPADGPLVTAKGDHIFASASGDTLIESATLSNLAINNSTVSAKKITYSTEKGVLDAEGTASMSIVEANIGLAPGQADDQGPLNLSASAVSARIDPATGGLSSVSANGNVVLEKDASAMRAECDTFTWDAPLGKAVLVAAPTANMTFGRQEAVAERITADSVAGAITLEGKKSVKMVLESGESIDASSEGDAVLSMDGSEIILKDKAVILKGDVKITAEYVRIERDIEANTVLFAFMKTKVRVTSPNASMSGDELTWNSDGGKLVISGSPCASIESEQNMFQSEVITIEGYKDTGEWDQLTARNSKRKGALIGKAKKTD